MAVPDPPPLHRRRVGHHLCGADGPRFCAPASARPHCRPEHVPGAQLRPPTRSVIVRDPPAHWRGSAHRSHPPGSVSLLGPSRNAPTPGGPAGCARDYGPPADPLEDWREAAAQRRRRAGRLDAARRRPPAVGAVLTPYPWHPCCWLRPCVEPIRSRHRSGRRSQRRSRRTPARGPEHWLGPARCEQQVGALAPLPQARRGLPPARHAKRDP